MLFHLGLGILIYFVGFSAKLYFALFTAVFLFQIIRTANKTDLVLVAAAYTTGFEVFSRMTQSAFSYEFAKYMVIIYVTIGMFYKGFKVKSWPFVVFLILLVPGVLFSAINLSYDSNVANAIGFNLSGPVCLGIATLYCYDRRIKEQRFQDILTALLLPIISMTVYLYLYTPSIKDVLTGTASNFATSGGFGPNQVATVIGLGCFILFVRIIQVKSLFINALDAALLGLIAYRGIITFSRGGILTGGVCIGLFVLLYFLNGRVKQKVNLIMKFSVFVLLIGLVWIVSSSSTGGLIDKRYSNQDAAGREKEDVTTGRVDLLNKELEAFYQNPITGIGVGKIREYRLQETGKNAATHNEVSRMLSEHGSFGLVALMLLFFTPLVYRIKNRSNLLAYSFFAFWFFTINHSSMRIAAPAFVYGLVYLTIIRENSNTLRRKRLAR